MNQIKLGILHKLQTRMAQLERESEQTKDELKLSQINKEMKILREKQSTVMNSTCPIITGVKYGEEAENKTIH